MFAASTPVTKLYYAILELHRLHGLPYLAYIFRICFREAAKVQGQLMERQDIRALPNYPALMETTTLSAPRLTNETLSLVAHTATNSSQ